MRVRNRARTMMNWRPRNLEESLIPLVILQGLIGHGVFHCSLCKATLWFSVAYSATVASGFLAAAYFAAEKLCKANWLHAGEKTLIYVTGVNIAIWAFAGIISWFNRNRYLQAVQKVSVIDESLRQLGASSDYNAIFRLGMRSVIVCVFAIIASTVIDIIWMHGRLSVGQTIFYSVIYHYPIHVNTVFIVNVAISTGLVRSRIAKINGILETISSNSTHQNDDLWRLSWRKDSESYNRIFVSSTRKSREIDKRLIQIIKHMHLELCRIPQDIEQSYGVQIALEMAANFVVLSGLLYDIYWFMAMQSEPHWLAYVMMKGFWFAMYFTKLLYICCSCVSMINETQRTGQIIHGLRVPNDETSFKDEIRQFGLQMILNPVRLSPAGMFALDNRFVTKFLATMITYVVIVIQMGDTPLGRGKNKNN